MFCLYAEDAGIFGQHGMFHDYLEEFDARKMRKAMIELFPVSYTHLSGMLVIASIIEKDNISFFRGIIGWKIIRKITAGNIRPIF